MHDSQSPGWIAFDGHCRIGQGRQADVAVAAKRAVDRGAKGPVLVFRLDTSEPIEIDLRGSVSDVVARIESGTSSLPDADASANQPRRPGRPRLGVVAREVTLLPRHWEWLNSQPGGASVTLRKLIDAARRSHGPSDERRRSREAAYKFMVALGGDLAGFEEATRALFAGNASQFEAQLASWPVDVREHAQQLASASFARQVDAG